MKRSRQWAVESGDRPPPEGRACCLIDSLLISSPWNRLAHSRCPAETQALSMRRPSQECLRHRIRNNFNEVVPSR